MRLITTLSTLLFIYSGISQQAEIDSLKSIVKSSQNDSIRATIFNQLAWDLKYSDPNTSMLYADSAISTSKNLSPKMLGNSIYYKAIIYYLTGDFEKAISNAQIALEKYENANYAYGQASIYNLLGLINNRIGAFEEAISSYHHSLQIAEAGDNLYAISNPYHNIALIYLDTKDYNRALEYAEKALDVRYQIGDSSFIAQSYQTIGGILWHLKRNEQSRKYLLDSERIFIQLGDKNSLSITYTNLGLLYRDIGKLKESTHLFEQASKISENLGDNENLANALVNLSGNYLALNQPKKALLSAQNAYKISKENGLLPSQKESLEVLCAALEAEEEYYKAYQYSKELIMVSDSLLNTERSQQIENLEISFSVSEKENQISLQKAQISEQESELQRKQTLLFAAILVIAFLIIIGLLLRNRLRKKQQIRLQEAEIRAQEAELNATISSQEKERARYARDLHDGFGQMISVLNMNLRSLQDGAKPNERQKVFDASEKVIDEMYGELKNICFDLMPQTLIKHGLESALNEFAGRINQAEKIYIELNIFGLDERITEIQEISLYRISQEWVNNILKYSDADKITLQITKDENEITLLIEDNGTGFDKILLEQGKGNGWKNLNTRTRLIQGELELETTPNQKGNVIIVNAPSTLKTIVDKMPV